MPNLVPITKNEATASRRRMYFHLVNATDGMTPENGEAAEQPQISTNGGAWTNTGIGTLTLIGNGRYYADLTQAATNIAAGSRILTRYKSANTAEGIGDTAMIQAGDQATELHLVKAMLANKQIQTIATGIVEVKDDDGTTTLKTLTPSVDSTTSPTQNILTPS